MQTLRRIFPASLISPRKATPHAPSCAASFSASGLSQTALPDSASVDLLSEQLKHDFDFYSKHTRDPIFRILPRDVNGTPAEKVLAAARVPGHEYASWANNLRGGTFSDIAHRLSQTGMHAPQNLRT